MDFQTLYFFEICIRQTNIVTIDDQADSRQIECYQNKRLLFLTDFDSYLSDNKVQSSGVRLLFCNAAVLTGDLRSVFGLRCIILVVFPWH